MTDAQGPSVFLRKSSGLVKNAGLFDVFIFNFGTISVGIAITLAHFFVPANYPGASLPLAELLAAAFMVCIAWGFWCWTAVIPRSGGVYAFVSRGLSPSLGFAVSFVDTLTFLFYNALAATYLTTIGIGPLLFSLGTLSHRPSLCRVAASLQIPAAEFVIGTVIILGAAAVLIAGMRVFFVLQKVLLVVSLIGSAATVVVLLSASHASFLQHFDAAFGGYLGSVQF